MSEKYNVEEDKSSSRFCRQTIGQYDSIGVMIPQKSTEGLERMSVKTTCFETVSLDSLGKRTHFITSVFKNSEVAVSRTFITKNSISSSSILSITGKVEEDTKVYCVFRIPTMLRRGIYLMPLMVASILIKKNKVPSIKPFEDETDKTIKVVDLFLRKPSSTKPDENIIEVEVKPKDTLYILGPELRRNSLVRFERQKCNLIFIKYGFIFKIKIPEHSENDFHSCLIYYLKNNIERYIALLNIKVVPEEAPSQIMPSLLSQAYQNDSLITVSEKTIPEQLDKAQSSQGENSERLYAEKAIEAAALEKIQKEEISQGEALEKSEKEETSQREISEKTEKEEMLKVAPEKPKRKVKLETIYEEDEEEKDGTFKIEIHDDNSESKEIIEIMDENALPEVEDIFEIEASEEPEKKIMLEVIPEETEEELLVEDSEEPKKKEILRSKIPNEKVASLGGLINKVQSFFTKNTNMSLKDLLQKINYKSGTSFYWFKVEDGTHSQNITMKRILSEIDNDDTTDVVGASPASNDVSSNTTLDTQSSTYRVYADEDPVNEGFDDAEKLKYSVGLDKHHRHSHSHYVKFEYPHRSTCQTDKCRFFFDSTYCSVPCGIGYRVSYNVDLKTKNHIVVPCYESDCTVDELVEPIIVFAHMSIVFTALLFILFILVLYRLTHPPDMNKDPFEAYDYNLNYS